MGVFKNISSFLFYLFNVLICWSHIKVYNIAVAKTGWQFSFQTSANSVIHYKFEKEYDILYLLGWFISRIIAMATM